MAKKKTAKKKTRQARKVAPMALEDARLAASMYDEYGAGAVVEEGEGGVWSVSSADGLSRGELTRSDKGKIRHREIVSRAPAGEAAAPLALPDDPGTSKGATDLGALAELLNDSGAGAARRAVAMVLAQIKAGRITV